MLRRCAYVRMLDTRASVFYGKLSIPLILVRCTLWFLLSQVLIYFFYFPCTGPVLDLTLQPFFLTFFLDPFLEAAIAPTEYDVDAVGRTA